MDAQPCVQRHRRRGSALANRTIRTSKNETALLAKLRAGKSIAAACRAARVGRSSYYDWRGDDPAFAAACDDAIEEGTDALEDRAHTRAMKDSDTLLIFLLKARRPDKYHDRSKLQLSGDPDAPMIFNFIRDGGDRADE